MSDGGKVESEQNEDNAIVLRTGHDDFGQAVSRTAVAQICEATGFDCFNSSALNALGDITIRYICDLGKVAKFYANLAGRTESNVFDVIQGLDDLSFSVDGSNCLMSSSVVREIREYVESAEEVPFAQPLPCFPVVGGKRMVPSFVQMGEIPVFKHVPAWLPAFPDPHTYMSSPVWNERASDPRTDLVELARQRRKAERSLLSLQQRLVCNGVSTSAEPDGVENGENVFLAKPFQAGEKDVDVSPVFLPEKSEKRVSLLDAFAPAIEGMKDGMDESGSDGEKNVQDKRPVICLEFKGVKKMFGDSLDLRIRDKTLGRAGPWFGREDERDDKKRRVEFILRQSMENQQEPPQL